MEVAVQNAGEGRYRVSAGDGLLEIEVLDQLTYLARSSLDSKEESRTRVDAYMPGRVVALLVKEGERVEKGQGVLVLEAMKMENEIRSESAGEVRRLHVQMGEAVETGDPLFEIE